MSKVKDCQEFDSISQPQEAGSEDSTRREEKVVMQRQRSSEQGAEVEGVTAVDGKKKKIKTKHSLLNSLLRRPRRSSPSSDASQLPDSQPPSSESEDPKQKFAIEEELCSDCSGADLTELEERVRDECREQMQQWEEKREAEWRAKVQELERELKGVQNELDKERVKGGGKSPFSSPGEEVTVAEDNLTDTDKSEIQDKLKRSQDEVLRLWNHNKQLIEKLKVTEGQLKELKGAFDEERVKGQQKVQELERELKGVQNELYEEKLERGDEVHGEMPSLASPQLACGGEFKGHECLRSNNEEETTYASLGEEKPPFSSLDDVELREKLSMCDLEAEINQLKTKLKASQSQSGPELIETAHNPLSEEMAKIKESLEKVKEAKAFLEGDISAERENNQRLMSEVARLEAALHFFWVFRNPQGQQDADSGERKQMEQLYKSKVSEFLKTIANKEAAVRSLTNCRSVLEKRLERLEKEKEMMTKETKDLKDEIEARKLEMETVTEGFNTERRERENMASKHADEYGIWTVHEQDLKKEVEEYRMLVDELKEKVEQGTYKKLEDQISRTTQLKQETDQRCERLREERDVMQVELNRVAEMYERVESENKKLREQLRSLQGPPDVALLPIRRADVVIRSPIGAGGWGTVKSGKFRGCKVAIKELHQGIMHESTVERMKREAKNMARVHHPNLVTFIGAVFDDGKLPIIVIELMEANLRGTYEKRAFTHHQMTSIFKDVAYALHYLHSLREPLIHRDLSSANVLLNSLPNERFLAKVSDFGSSNLVESAKTAGEGAIIYSAPESFPVMDASEDQPKQTVKMDTYSYGVLLCEVVNHRLPESKHRNTMLAVVAKQWNIMHKLIVRCTKRDPMERPTMRDILNHLQYEVELSATRS